MNPFQAVREIEKICRSVLVADRLRFTFTIGDFMQPKPATPGATSRPPVPAKWGNPAKRFNASISSNDATFDITGVSTVSVSVSPVEADGSPSQATLSLDNFVSSDSTVLSVQPDPSNTNGAIIAFTAAGTATLTATATATEPDGTTTEQIQGVGAITLTESAPAVAASLAFTYGTPQ
jgi:hypothetical protein